MSELKASHAEMHRSHRGAWLRAAVLGVNDGIVSTSSIMLGVIAAAQSDAAILTAGIAGLVAGALSMAAGEYVSVSSQRDSELYDIAVEARELAKDPEAELEELARIYEGRGLDATLARQVAEQLHEGDAVRAHVRDDSASITTNSQNQYKLRSRLRSHSHSAAHSPYSRR